MKPSFYHYNNFVNTQGRLNNDMYKDSTWIKYASISKGNCSCPVNIVVFTPTKLDYANKHINDKSQYYSPFLLEGI